MAQVTAQTSKFTTTYSTRAIGDFPPYFSAISDEPETVRNGYFYAPTASRPFLHHVMHSQATEDDALLRVVEPVRFSSREYLCRALVATLPGCTGTTGVLAP